MMKRIIFLVIILVLIISSPNVFSQEQPSNNLSNKENNLNTDTDLKVETGSVESAEWDAPDWLKRTQYGIFIESDKRPRYYLETVQPLYQSGDGFETVFTHDRISIQGGRGLYAVGIGYRRLIFDEQLIAGMNSFFDYQDEHRHYRQGFGLEAIGKKFEWRANTYFRLSPKRLIEDDGSTKVYEEVANGFDMEIGTPVPYLPWCKVFGSFYHYNFKRSSDMNGWRLRSEIKPFKFFTLNIETFNDNKGEQEYRLDTRFSLAFHDFSIKSLCSAFKADTEPYKEIDLKERMLDRVERDFDIKVEKWLETSNITVAIGRAD